MSQQEDLASPRRDLYGVATHRSELAVRLARLDATLEELGRHDSRRFRRHLPLVEPPSPETTPIQSEANPLPRMGTSTQLVELRVDPQDTSKPDPQDTSKPDQTPQVLEPPTDPEPSQVAPKLQSRTGHTYLHQDVVRLVEELCEARLAETEDCLEELWYNHEAEQQHQERLRLESNAMRIDVVKKIMAIMFGYCLSKFVVTVLENHISGQVGCYALYTTCAAVVSAAYLTFAKPRMAGESFLKHAMQLGVAMAPVILGWAFRDTVIAFYNEVLLDSDGNGKYPKGTNWAVQIGVALLWLLIVAGFAFLRCVRKEVFSFDTKGNFFNHLKQTFLYTPLSIGWALNKGFQSVYLDQINADDIWNGFCLYAGFSFVFSGLTAALVNRLRHWSHHLEGVRVKSKKHLQATRTMLHEQMADSERTFRREEFVTGNYGDGEQFDALDRNKDGVIDQSELKDAKDLVLMQESLELGSKLGIAAVTFLCDSLGFVFAWTWNYVITYFWFVAVFRCTDDPNKIVGKNLCGPAPNMLLSVLLTTIMWFTVPRFTVTLKKSNSTKALIRWTLQLAAMTKSSIGVIVGWAWTNYIGAQLDKNQGESLDSAMSFMVATLVVGAVACVLFHAYKVSESTLQAALISVQEERLELIKLRKQERIESKKLRIGSLSIGPHDVATNPLDEKSRSIRTKTLDADERLRDHVTKL